MIPCFLIIFMFIIKVVFYKIGDDESEKSVGSRGNKVFW